MKFVFEIKTEPTFRLGWKCRCRVVFFLGPIDTTQRHVVDSVGDTKNHVGDIGLMSPHADHVGVVSFRTNPDMCLRHVGKKLLIVVLRYVKNTTDSTTTPTMVSVRPLSLRGFEG
jgi:hypothetical protein